MTSTVRRAEYKACIKNNHDRFKAWLGDSKEEFYHNMGNLMGNSYSSDKDLWNKWKIVLESDKANIEALNRATSEWKKSEEYKQKADCTSIIGKVTYNPDVLAKFKDVVVLSLNDTMYKAEDSTGTKIIYELATADYNWSKSLIT